MEYTFYTNNLELFANFDILGELGSRCVHVVNASCKIIKFGIIHVTTFRSTGLIDSDYEFEFIINNINQPPFTITLDNSVGTDRARTIDLENLNLFLNAGDCIGIRYNSGNIGNYMQARILVDTNRRQGDFNSESIQ